MKNKLKINILETWPPFLTKFFMLEIIWLVKKQVQLQKGWVQFLSKHSLWQKSLKMQNFTTETQLFCNKLYLIFEFWSFVFYCKYFVRGNTIILYICDFFLQLYNFSNYCKKNTKVLHFQKYFVLYTYSKYLNAWFSHCG